MDVKDQFAAFHSRHVTRGRGILCLLTVVALLVLLPASALADRSNGSAGQGREPATVVLAHDGPSEDGTPVDPTPPVLDPAPPVTDPTPPVVDPAPPADPAPVDPAPPAEPTPPADPAPPADPVPPPADPAPPAEPAPVDPTPPEDTVPVDPAPMDPAPTDPAPREGRAPTPKQPDTQPDPSTDQPAPTPDLAPPPVADLSPAATSSGASPQPAVAGDDQGTALRVVAVREALARLGIGTIAAPSIVDTTPVVVAAAPAQACSPVGSVGAVASPQTAAALAGHPISHPHGTSEEPTHLRGPPVPLDTQSSPFATGGTGGAAPGGANGERDCAIHPEQILFELADGGTVVVADSCDHVAPAPANAAARAPPVA